MVGGGFTLGQCHWRGGGGFIGQYGRRVEHQQLVQVECQCSLRIGGGAVWRGGLCGSGQHVVECLGQFVIVGHGGQRRRIGKGGQHGSVAGVQHRCQGQRRAFLLAIVRVIRVQRLGQGGRQAGGGTGVVVQFGNQQVVKGKVQRFVAVHGGQAVLNPGIQRKVVCHRLQHGHGIHRHGAVAFGAGQQGVDKGVQVGVFQGHLGQAGVSDCRWDGGGFQQGGRLGQGWHRRFRRGVVPLLFGRGGRGGQNRRRVWRGRRGRSGDRRFRHWRRSRRARFGPLAAENPGKGVLFALLQRKKIHLGRIHRRVGRQTRWWGQFGQFNIHIQGHWLRAGSRRQGRGRHDGARRFGMTWQKPMRHDTELRPVTVAAMLGACCAASKPGPVCPS